MTRARVALLVLLTLVVQLAVLPSLRVGGVRPDAMLLLAVAAGLVGGAETGAVVGFVVGVVADLFVQTPFGLTAMTFAFVGFGTGALQSGLLRTAWWVAPVAALLASAAGVVLFAVLGAVVGQGHLVTTRLVPIAIVVGVANAFLSLAVVPAMGWALGGPGHRSFAR